MTRPRKTTYLVALGLFGAGIVLGATLTRPWQHIGTVSSSEGPRSMEFFSSVNGRQYVSSVSFAELERSDPWAGERDLPLEASLAARIADQALPGAPPEVRDWRLASLALARVDHAHFVYVAQYAPTFPVSRSNAMDNYKLLVYLNGRVQLPRLQESDKT